MYLFYRSLLFLACICLYTSLYSGQSSESNPPQETQAVSRPNLPAPPDSRKENSSSPDEKLQAIKVSTDGLERSVNFVLIIALVLFFIVIGSLWVLYIKLINDVRASVKNIVIRSPESKQASDRISRGEHQEQINAKDAQIEKLRNTKDDEITRLQDKVNSLNKTNQSLTEKSDDSATNLTAKQYELDGLRAEQTSLKSSNADLESAHKNLKSALIPSSVLYAESSLGDDLIGSLSEDSPHSVSLLGCLVMLKVAAKIDISEEVLLTTVRQFSESFTAFRMQQARPVEVVQEELVEWANIFNKQFDGKLEIRVPTPGFSVDSKTMISSSGALKVSAVYSWSVYNSKGSVFSPAKIA